MSITPKAIQDLLDELESSNQSRLRAWNVLQRLRLVLSEAGNVTIPPPAQKTFDAEGEALERGLTKSFRIRNEAIKSLCSSVRRFRDATIRQECKSDYPHALQALWKALERAEDLIQSQRGQSTNRDWIAGFPGLIFGFAAFFAQLSY
jgi:hypothetical protein